MQENKNLVEEALIQMKNVEDVIAENAKGILASTMKEEISQLVKESLSEQEEDDELEMDSMDSENEVDVDVDMSSDDEEGDEEVDVDFETDNVSDMEEPIDLTDASDEEILRVFKAMGEDDGIIVKKDDEMVHLKDNDQDAEYLIKLGESEEENYENMEYNEEVSDDKVQDVIDAIFSDEPNIDDLESSDDMEVEDDEEEVVYEIEFNEDSDEEMMESDDEDMMEEESEIDEEWGGNKGDFKRRKGHKIGDVDGHYKDYEMDESDDEDMMESADDEEEAVEESAEEDEGEETLEESVQLQKVPTAKMGDNGQNTKSPTLGANNKVSSNGAKPVAAGYQDSGKGGTQGGLLNPTTKDVKGAGTFKNAPGAKFNEKGEAAPKPKHGDDGADKKSPVAESKKVVKKPVTSATNKKIVK